MERFSDHLDPLHGGEINRCGDVDSNMNRTRVRCTTPNKHSRQPECCFGRTANELTHNRNILSCDRIPKRLTQCSSKST